MTTTQRVEEANLQAYGQPKCSVTYQKDLETKEMGEADGFVDGSY